LHINFPKNYFYVPYKKHKFQCQSRDIFLSFLHMQHKMLFFSKIL
jgi:hypothetical protein